VNPTRPRALDVDVLAPPALASPVLGAGPLGAPVLDHVGIAVHDADAALHYYRGVLGLAVIGDEVAEEPGSRLVWLDAGAALLQIVQPLRRNRITEFLTERGEGLHHVCFAVRDPADAMAALGQQQPVFLGGRGRRACFLAGTPTGVSVELVDGG